MAQCIQTPQEFVQNAFNPVIAVLTTPKVENVCQKNNLSFVDLVQPFCKLNAEVHLRDPTNQTYPVRNLRLNLVEMNHEAPKQMEARKMLYDVVASTLQNTIDRTRMIETDNYSLQINNSAAWFEAYREWYLKVAPLSEHEFTGHFLASIMVVSADDSEVMMEFARMSQEQHNHQYQNITGKVNQWFLTNPLKYYVLVQDIAEHDQAKTELVFQNMKTTYGANSCHLLRINSRDLQSTSCFHDPQSNLPDPWSQFLSRRPTITTESGEATITTPSPIDDQEIDALSQNSTMVHPLMSQHYQKLSASSIAIEFDDESDSRFPAGQKMTVDLSNLTLNSESDFANEQTTPTTLSGGRKPGSYLLHGVCLSSEDTDRIRLFIQEFSMRSLLPFIEKQMSILNEQVTNRKGLHRSFFSATKKWFGGNKPGPTVGNKASLTSVIYSPDSVELLVRHLADLAFMFQHYELAYQAYHSIKRDFNSDQAWLYYSGALEMAALSVFMQGNPSQRQVPFHYFDTAINTYLNTCKNPVLATRSTLLATECLKYFDRHLEAANYFVRLTSEESDLRSALLLEQAAYCHLNVSSVNVRKYAFYMILAGHRFNKAGQKKHALRCYQQSLQVYQGKQWMLAEDHINLTTGRLNYTLNQLENAIASFYKLLYDGSLQGVDQQMYYVREYLTICSHWLKKSENGSLLPRLPIPVMNAQDSVLVLGETGQVANNDGDDFQIDIDTIEQTWYQLEEATILKATGSVPVTHRPMLQRYCSDTNNTKSPLAIVGEPITLLLPIRNPLNISLMVTDVHLTWNFEISESSEEIDSSQPGAERFVDTKIVPEVAFSGQQVLTVRLSMVPLQTGQLRLRGIAFNLKIQNVMQSNSTDGGANGSFLNENEIEIDNYISVRGSQPFEIKGHRLNSTKEERCGVLYSKDLRLEPLIVPVMPRLTVKCENFQKKLYCGQVCANVFEVFNCGSAAVKRIFIATDTPNVWAFGRPQASPIQLTNDSSYFFANVTDSVENHKGIFEIPLPDGMDVLPPGKHLWLPFWVQGPGKTGSHLLNLLFYYESPPSTPAESQRPRYRLLRLSSKLETTEVISACAIALSGPQPVGKDLHQNVAVAVELSNINSSSSVSDELELLQISCASNRWEIEDLGGSSFQGVKINSKESLKCCFRAVQKHVADDVSSLHFSDISFQSPKIESSKCPCVSFYNSTIVKSKIDEKKDVSNANDSKATMGLILIWKYVDETKLVSVYGQHHIIIDKLNTIYYANPVESVEEKPLVPFVASAEPTSPTVEEKKSTQYLRYYVFSPGDIKHDFSISRACIIPVYLVFYNDTAFEVETEVDANRLQTDSTLTSTRDAGKFAWIGCCRTTLRIKSQETKVVYLQGCFFNHGTYSLDAIGIAAKPCSDNMKLNLIKVSGSAQLQMIWDTSRNHNKPISICR
ncbi:Trafficking protein particle complex 8 [Chamberlinius hualienensis]